MPKNTDLLYQYEQYYDAENGNSLVLTLDATVQHSLEKNMESMLDKFDAKNGGTGIVMDVNTGAIIAMASYPNYDLQDYGSIYDETLQEQLDEKLAELAKNRSSYANGRGLRSGGVQGHQRSDAEPVAQQVH